MATWLESGSIFQDVEVDHAYVNTDSSFGLLEVQVVPELADVAMVAGDGHGRFLSSPAS